MDINPRKDIIYHLRKINTILPKATSTTFGLVKTIILMLFILTIISLVAASYSLYDKKDKSTTYKIGIYTGTGISGLIILIIFGYIIYYYNNFDNYLKPISDSINYIRQDLQNLENIREETIKNVSNIGLRLRQEKAARKSFQVLNRGIRPSQYSGTENVQKETLDLD